MNASQHKDYVLVLGSLLIGIIPTRVFGPAPTMPAARASEGKTRVRVLPPFPISGSSSPQICSRANAWHGPGLSHRSPLTPLRQRLLERTRRQVSLSDQIDLIAANLLWAQVRRRPTEVPREPGDILDVRPLRVPGEIPYLPVLEHALPKGGSWEAPLLGRMAHPGACREAYRGSRIQCDEEPGGGNHDWNVALSTPAKRVSPMRPIVRSRLQAVARGACRASSGPAFTCGSRRPPPPREVGAGPTVLGPLRLERGHEGVYARPHGFPGRRLGRARRRA